MKKYTHNTWRTVLLCIIKGSLDAFGTTTLCEHCKLRSYCDPLWKKIKDHIDKNELDD